MKPEIYHIWINGKLISNGKEIYSVLGFPLRSTLGTKISIFISITYSTVLNMLKHLLSQSQCLTPSQHSKTQYQRYF